ncbi:hypothetical protein AA313_de0210410 [Arthrobotrys entomopaga]|nr:hypothetical protein AA313_de0210410 [Arthrobotrys entomopaga]
MASDSHPSRGRGRRYPRRGRRNRLHVTQAPRSQQMQQAQAPAPQTQPQISSVSSDRTPTSTSAAQQEDAYGFGMGSDVFMGIYTREEEQFIKDKYKTEDLFLRTFGLKFFEPEDLAEGRQILRSLMVETPDNSDHEGSPKKQNHIVSSGRLEPSAANFSASGSTPTDAGRPLPTIKKSSVESNILPNGDIYNTDWIFSSSSNIHIAKNKEWFKTYIPFKAVTNENIEIIGAGTVELPVTTNKGVAILTLRNVAHAPFVGCNVAGNGLIGEYGVRICNPSSRVYLDHREETWAILDNTEVYRLRLVNQSPTQTSLEKDKSWCIRASLPSDELTRMATEVLEEEIRVLRAGIGAE